MMDVKAILERIPHRYPFLLVDRILEVETGVRIVGIKNVTYNEVFFSGSLPASPGHAWSIDLRSYGSGRCDLCPLLGIGN